MTMVTQKLEILREQAAEPYIAPQLRLVGNLNDLLAGTGTQNSDSTEACPGGSAFFNPLCAD
jgi:hypothetical protein